MEIKERIDVMRAAATLLTSLQDPFTWTLGSLSIPGLDLVEFSKKRGGGPCRQTLRLKTRPNWTLDFFFFFYAEKVQIVGLTIGKGGFSEEQYIEAERQG